MTTIAGWVPWLADTLDPCDGQETFDTYVRQDPVLLAPGEAGRSTAPHWPPWIPVRHRNGGPNPGPAPACAADPDRGTSLLAALHIMTTCGEHGWRLEPEMSVRLAALDRDAVPSPPVPAPVAAMDRLIHEGLTTGMVTLARREVHVGVRFRLLRILLDEVSMAASRVGPQSAATLARVWDATCRPASALALTEAGAVTARGTLARF